MDDIIPSKDQRKINSLRIGSQLYTEKNWKAIIEGISALDQKIASIVEQIPYGSVYPREGLDLQKREIAAISVLTQLGLKSQLKSHIIAALNVGVTKDEILELFLHLAMFLGFPIVLDGLRNAHEVFEQKGI